MDQRAAILVTGAAGFIGSCMVGYLNNRGYENIILCDDFSRDDKLKNYTSKKYSVQVDREDLFDWIESDKVKIDFVFHLGAKTDTTEFNYAIHEKLNVVYSKKIWEYCTAARIPLVYASSAATYGDGELGYADSHEIIDQLKPLNPYGISKNEFDRWAVRQDKQPPFWAGLKFFNVYGPNEYHKGRMASVIFHSFNQIRDNGKVRLFRSHKPGYPDGGQLRDFIYVEDVIAVCYWIMERYNTGTDLPQSGLYNLGTGTARTFNDLVKAIFTALNMEPSIEYIDTPVDIRDKYQYFTEADMSKLRSAGYTAGFYSLEKGVEDYVRNYLVPAKYY